MNNANPEEPTIPHKYLTTSSGSPLKFFRLLDEVCPACMKGPTSSSKLAILREEASQETVHCVSCDYTLTRRPRPKRLPPMNSGRAG